MVVESVVLPFLAPQESPNLLLVRIYLPIYAVCLTEIFWGQMVLESLALQEVSKQANFYDVHDDLFPVPLSVSPVEIWGVFVLCHQYGNDDIF